MGQSDNIHYKRRYGCLLHQPWGYVPISGSNRWSSCRYDSNNAWNVNGNNGCAWNNNLYNAYVVRPLSNLYNVRKEI